MLVTAFILLTCGIVIVFIIWQVVLTLSYRKAAIEIQKKQLIDLQRAESTLRDNVQRMQRHREALQRDLKNVLREASRFEDILNQSRPDAVKAVPKSTDEDEDNATL